MPKTNKYQTFNKCSQCGHEWLPRLPRLAAMPKKLSAFDKKSVLCPKCKSPYWDSPFKVASPQKGRREFYGKG